MPIYYTYLIGWSNTQMFYYGVRYSKKAHPSELFISYFTSSKHVKNYIKKHGMPNIIQIRKTFLDRNKAIKWEHDVLNKMNLKEDRRFLNATNNPGIEPKKFNRAKNFEKWLSLPYEQRYSDSHIKALQKHGQERVKHLQKNDYHIKKPDDTSNYKNAAYKRWADPDFKKKMKSRKWYYNDLLKQSKMLLPENVKEDWSLGRKYY